jgi:hypothetical protein
MLHLLTGWALLILVILDAPAEMNFRVLILYLFIFSMMDKQS